MSKSTNRHPFSYGGLARTSLRGVSAYDGRLSVRLREVSVSGGLTVYLILRYIW